jgi:hypothetical protein
VINEALGRIVAAFEGGLVFISEYRKPLHCSVHCVFRRSFQTLRRIVPCGGLARDLHPAPHPFKGDEIKVRHSQYPAPQWASAADPAPRTGSSSGVRPGSSCGDGASPGSRSGGGTSGRGFPGGLSCGGSDGSVVDRRILLRIDRHFRAFVIQADGSTARRRQCSGRLEHHAGSMR